MQADESFTSEAAGLRTDAAADERRRRRDLVQQDLETAAFVGVLVDVAERDQRVTLRSATGDHHVGSIHAVGRDFVALHTDAGLVVVALASVASVTVGGEAGRLPSNRRAPSAASLRDLLADLAVDQPRVRVRAINGAALNGWLLDVGADLLRIRLDGNAGVSYVALWSLAEASFTGSG